MPIPAGLAHVAAVSFLSARVAPTGSFWLSLAGGAAVARESEERGMRSGYASSTAAMLQTVAMDGVRQTISKISAGRERVQR